MNKYLKWTINKLKHFYDMHNHHFALFMPKTGRTKNAENGQLVNGTRCTPKHGQVFNHN
jgi:hypothetical protein